MASKTRQRVRAALKTVRKHAASMDGAEYSYIPCRRWGKGERLRRRYMQTVRRIAATRSSTAPMQVNNTTTNTTASPCRSIAANSKHHSYIGAKRRKFDIMSSS